MNLVHSLILCYDVLWNKMPKSAKGGDRGEEPVKAYEWCREYGKQNRRKGSCIQEFY